MNENTTVRTTDEDEIDLLDLFFLLLSNFVFIVVGAIVVGAIVFAYNTFLVKPTYTSTTSMYVLNRNSTDSNGLNTSDLSVANYLTKDYVQMIRSRTVVENVIASLDLDMTVSGLLEELSVNSQTDTRIIQISITDGDPYRARDIANMLRIKAAEHIKNVMNIEAVNVVDEANVPSTKTGPKTLRNTLIGGFIGALLVAAYFIILYLIDDKINTAEDVESYLGLSVLGQLPIDEKLLQEKKLRDRKRKKSKASRKKKG